MRLIRFPASREATAVQQLPEFDMVVDPRPIGWWGLLHKFEVTVKNGTTLTITLIDQPEFPHDHHWHGQAGWWHDILFRSYTSKEDRYSFNSTLYLYHGLKDERAPFDVTEVIIKDGVETIDERAFCHCKSLVKVTIPDSVKRIEEGAFVACKSLCFIQLPPNLEYIGGDGFGGGAFEGCSSLEAVFLPPTVTEIAVEVFRKCTSLRILNIPDSVERIVRSYFMDDYESLMTDELAKADYRGNTKWLRNRYNPFHNLCCQPSPSPQAILQYIQGHSDNEVRARTNDKPQFTALHLLVANPSVTGDMVTAYLQLAPDVAMMKDNIEMTPLHMLCSLPQFSDSTGSVIKAYLAFKKGKEVAFMTDRQGKTPFQYLCEKSFDDMPFLKNKGFGGLFVWWFDCLEMNLFKEGVGENENIKIRKRKFSGDEV